jgi:hypothetical protein
MLKNNKQRGEGLRLVRTDHAFAACFETTTRPGLEGMRLYRYGPYSCCWCCVWMLPVHKIVKRVSRWGVTSGGVRWGVTSSICSWAVNQRPFNNECCFPETHADASCVVACRWYLAQQYVPNPMLLDGRKFGIRLWVLVTGIRPLRLYVHRNGLVLLSTHR